MTELSQWKSVLPIKFTLHHPRFPCPQIKDDKGFHVYTLHVKADNTFDLYVDTEVTASGNLLNDFKPSVNPPQEIDDPDDVQPEDWVTQVGIRTTLEYSR